VAGLVTSLRDPDIAKQPGAPNLRHAQDCGVFSWDQSQLIKDKLTGKGSARRAAHPHVKPVPS
jgi:hypothetical protein